MYYENDYEIEIPELEPVPTNDHFYIFKKLFVPLSSFTFWMQWLAIMALTIGLCFFGILFVQCGILILGMAANLTSMAIIITYSLQIFYQTADQDDMFEGWPTVIFIESVLDGIWFFFILFMSMLPAWGFYLVFGIFFTTGRFPILYIILSLLFFFPIFLLGALANQTSRYNFISKEIFFSFKRIWPSWLFVYGTTLVIYVTILLLMYLIYLLDTQTVNSFGNYEHFRIALIMGGTLPLVLGTSFIFYMRMLGILARLVEQVIQDQTESLNN